MDGFEVKNDIALGGTAAGKNLASKVKPTTGGEGEGKLRKPLDKLKAVTLTVSVKDKARNLARIEQKFPLGIGKITMMR
jgi:hypothetical protein